MFVAVVDGFSVVLLFPLDCDLMEETAVAEQNEKFEQFTVPVPLAFLCDTYLILSTALHIRCMRVLLLCEEDSAAAAQR